MVIPSFFCRRQVLFLTVLSQWQIAVTDSTGSKTISVVTQWPVTHELSNPKGNEISQPDVLMFIVHVQSDIVNKTLTADINYINFL